MEIEKIRQFRNASPFCPFWIHVVGRGKVAVQQPDRLMISPLGNECAAYDADGALRFIDLALVTGVEHNPPHNRPPAKKPKT